MNEKPLNTVKKGDEFENLSAHLIEKALNDYKLGLIPSNCRVFKKKGYYSSLRKRNIIFDIAIEVWPEGSKNYAILNLIECKNYAKKVPVDDVEEFYAKISQVGHVNVKGIFITNNGFQKGAFTFAKSVGMMLIIVNDLISLNIILHKANRQRQIEEEYSYNVSGIENEDPIIQQMIFRKIQRKIDKELLSIFVYQVIANSYRRQEIDVPILSAEEIDEFTSSILMAYNPDVVNGERRLDWEKFGIFLSQVYELTISFDSMDGFDCRGHRIISHCSFLTKTIEVDKTLENTNRAPFLLAHELGHFFLHNRIALNQREYESFSDSAYNLSINRHELNNPRTWLEWQANQFAASLLLPRKSILYRLGIEQYKQGLQIGKPIYLDDQLDNRIAFNTIIANLARFYFTTKTSIIYRLNALDMIKINSRLKSVGQLIREIYPDLLQEPW
ncbi:ImmA/IrrE family metallo-endopeptidase [Rudanella lutea]|uniref:ImmA/IrrE family metallo-endopeptidase n=1 Tax=Rudanella lutea TaxID=451374 RepID=UPI00037E7520|nr:ImmA/IrrE family metallo-endopeptidase [Rudanella lutea]